MDEGPRLELPDAEEIRRDPPGYVGISYLSNRNILVTLCAGKVTGIFA